MADKRERYERANIRGGMGVRKRMSEDSMKDTYRLNGVQTGSVVVRAHDRYLADFTKGFDTGILVRKTASIAVIHWEGEDEPTIYNAGDARYEVDRGRWKFLGIMQGSPFDLNNPMINTLTRLLGEYKVGMSADAGNPAPLTDGVDETEETEEDMSEQSNAAKEREAAQKAMAEGSLTKRETYTAKQVATRCGTDSKTMRKFFRSSHSTVKAVGQGGRYEFDAKDLPKIQREFNAWQNKAKSGRTPIDTEGKKALQERIREVKKNPPKVTETHTDKPPRTAVPEGFGGIDRYGPNDPDVLPSFEMLPDDPSDDDIAELEGDVPDLDELDELDD